jgi:hypothetical protein
MPIESGMVKLAQSDSIARDWLSFRITVWNDMGSVEQCAMF